MSNKIHLNHDSSCKHAVITADGAIGSGPIILCGHMANSGTTVTLVLHDAADATNAVITTGTLTNGQLIKTPEIEFDTALFADVGGTTPNITIFYKPRD